MVVADKVITVRMTPELHEKIAKHVDSTNSNREPGEDRISMNRFCVNAIIESLNSTSFASAITNAGLDISPCMSCSRLVACIPDGQPMCEKCAKEEMSRVAKA
jgi:hypothetical protein